MNYIKWFKQTLLKYLLGLSQYPIFTVQLSWPHRFTVTLKLIFKELLLKLTLLQCVT